jgi:RimJ/RimL family protein N-acetyltransferase
MIAAMSEWDKDLLCGNLDYHRTDRLRGIKRVIDSEIVAMVGFDDFTANSVQAHIWIKRPHGFSKLFIQEVFRYAFEICDLGIVITVVPCHNTASLELTRRLGFDRVLTIKDGYALGTDLAIQEMRREKCRWFRQLEVPFGQQIRYPRSA